MRTIIKALITSTAFLIPITVASAAEDVVIVYDASGSMWGQIEGVSKIEIAREVMADLVNGWPDGANLGLVTYGHRSEGDCTDIETLIAPAPVDRSSFIRTVNAIQPKGKTPLSAAVQHAASALSWRDNPATVVLISDGVETCQADPCALAEQLSRQGVNFTTHVVGFDLADDAHDQLACIAENTGGVFVSAQNATELKDALAQVQNVMALQEQPEPEPEPELSQEPLPEITIEAPEQVATGSSFALSWSSSVHPQDYVTIVPVGADEGTFTRYERVYDKTENKLIAPAEPGLYEVRYMLKEGSRTLATAPVEVTEAEIGIAAPKQVTTGSSFALSWSSSVNPQDYVTIVPLGADEGTYTRYERVYDKTENKLIAPAEPGLYEVRYVLKEGSRTLASAPLEVVEADIAISGPKVVRAGTKLRATWTASVHPQDYVTIVPLGAAPDAYTVYVRVQDKLEGDVKVPAEPGLYEIRYVLNEGKRILASQDLEVVGADAPLDDGAGLSVPAQAGVGSTITVTWSSGSEGADQRITLARADQADFSWITAHPAGADNTLELQMPDEPGRYEVRFLNISDRQVLGRAIVEVD